MQEEEEEEESFSEDHVGPSEIVNLKRIFAQVMTCG